MYQIKEISLYNRDLLEQLGTKEKFWFHDGKDEKIKLFKKGRPNTGEDWSEKVACELAKLMDLPCANYEFAKWNDKYGTVSDQFVPENGRLVHGNEIIVKMQKNYSKKQFYHLKEYKLATVLAIVKSIPYVPIGYENHNDIGKPLGFFVGYLMFDCWISNPDRHHENWGLVINIKTMKVHLAPTYDHASGLGCRVSDGDRNMRLSTKDERYMVKAFVQRAKSAFFSKDNKRIKTIDAFDIAASTDKIAKKYWLNKLENIKDSEIKRIISNVPLGLMSDASKIFTFEILKENKKRLLELKRG